MAVDGALDPAVQAGPVTSRLPPRPVELEARLGHVFAQPDLLDLALTHVGRTQSRIASYQRLEFLGDRVLGIIVADMLYRAFPDAEEGELSRRLADLVRRETCAAVALDWGVEPHIRLGVGERKALKRAILGDICESIIGAVFLDGGFEAAQAVVTEAFAPRMLAPSRPLRDPKTTLQEWAQGRGLPAPVYREIARSGPHHAPEFTVAVLVEGHAEAQAKGPSKRVAEQSAAQTFMARELAPIETT